MKEFPAKIGWDNWGKLMCDIELFEPLLREICARHGLDANSIEAGFPGTHAVFCINSAFVIKIYAPLPLPDALVERAAYRAAKAARIPLLPQTLAEGNLRFGGHEWPYLVMRFARGRALRELWDPWPEKKRLDAARVLGDWARRYREARPEFPPDMPVSAAGWVEGFDATLQKNLVRLQEGGWSASTVRALRQAAETELNRMKQDAPVLVHGDLTEDHLLVDESEYAIIDPADSRMASALYDLPPLWFSAFKRDRAAYARCVEAMNLPKDRRTARALLSATLAHGYGAQTMLQAWPEESPPESAEDALATLFGVE